MNTATTGQKAEVSTAHVTIKRDVFYRDQPYSWFTRARSYQRAWSMAVYHRTPLAYRKWLRDVMRGDALEAVKMARLVAARDAAVAA